MKLILKKSIYNSVIARPEGRRNLTTLRLLRTFHVLAMTLIYSSFLYSAEKVILPEDLSTSVKIPAETGRIMEYHAGTTPFTIFYIQDAHVNIEAQRSIAKITEILHLKRDIRLVLVEGGIGDVSLTEYRVGPKEKRKEIAEQLLKEGKISGEEYLNFLEDYPLLLWGIESQVLYDENLIAFTKAEPLVPGTTRQLDDIARAIDAKKPELYPKDYLDFENQLKERMQKNDLAGESKLLLEVAKKVGLNVENGYPNIQVLAKLIQLEAGSDFERVDYERTQLVRELQRKVPSRELKKVLELEKNIEKDPLKRANFYEKLVAFAKEKEIETSKFQSLEASVSYLREQHKIDSLKFFDEKEKLEEQIAETSLKDPNSKELYRMSKDVELLKTLIKLELVPEHYNTFAEDRNRFKVAGWADFLKLTTKPSDLEKLDETIDSFQSFYRIANIRDQALVENLTQKIKDEKEPEAILIAGGFHKDRLIRKLLRIGFNVVVISPNVNIQQGPELYRKMLKEKWENGKWYIKEEQARE